MLRQMEATGNQTMVKFAGCWQSIDGFVCPEAAAVDFEFLDTRGQRGRFDIKKGRCAICAKYLALGYGQSMDDVVIFCLAQFVSGEDGFSRFATLFGIRFRQFATFAPAMFGQVEMQFAVMGKDGSTFDDVFKFAGVPGPAIILQGADLAFGQGWLGDIEALTDITQEV